MKLVFDLEANGLYDDKINKDGSVSKAADTIWCIVAKDIETGKVMQFTREIRGFSTETGIDRGLRVLAHAEELIGHNIIDYDLRLIKKLYPSFCPNGKILDTMILSQLLNPDRVNGHSLGQYGKELGHPKPEHEDWSQFSPEMLHRCTEDVEINHKVYDYLMKEAYEDVEGIPYNEVFANSL